MTKHPKRPRDPNQLARMIVDLAAGEATEEPAKPVTAAAQFARIGGLVGGKVRAATLSKERRVEIARKAARTRWKAGVDSE